MLTCNPVTDQTPFTPPSRRTSSHMGISHQQGGYDHGARLPNAGYGASRSRESFGEFAIGNNYHSNSFHGSVTNGNSPGGYTPRQDMRKQSDPTLSRNGIPGVYPAVGNSRSKDTLNTGASSGSDQWNLSTGPTSEEGSVERVGGVARPIPSHLPSSELLPPLSDDERSRAKQPYPVGQRRMVPPGNRGMYGNGRPPPQGGPPQLPQIPQLGGPRPPMKDGPAPPAHKIQLGAGGQYQNGPAPAPVPERRQSWLKRTFSRNK
jgi:hypothetical protein